MGPFGFGEIIFLFFIALVIFGPKRLPELGKTVGKGLREFKKASDELKSNWEQHTREMDNPVNDLKQTFSEIKSDVASAATIDNPVSDLKETFSEIKAEVESAATIEDEAPMTTPAAPEKKSPDAN
jgi:sec-independent protein translocase protein TatA